MLRGRRLNPRRSMRQKNERDPRTHSCRRPPILRPCLEPQGPGARARSTAPLGMQGTTRPDSVRSRRARSERMDVEPVNHMGPVEVDGAGVTLATPGDPPLLLTHVPLLQVPPRQGKHPRARAPAGVADQEPAPQRQRRAVELPAREAERHQAVGAPPAGRNRPGAQNRGAPEHRRDRHARTAVETIESHGQPRHERHRIAM